MPAALIKQPPSLVSARISRHPHFPSFLLLYFSSSMALSGSAALGPGTLPRLPLSGRPRTVAATPLMSSHGEIDAMAMQTSGELVPELSTRNSRSRSPRLHQRPSRALHPPSLVWHEAALESASAFYALQGHAPTDAGPRRVTAAQGVVWQCRALNAHQVASPIGLRDLGPLQRFNTASSRLAALVAASVTAHTDIMEHAPGLLDEARQELATIRGIDESYLRFHDPEGSWSAITIMAMAGQLRALTAELPAEALNVQQSVASSHAAP